VEPKVLLNSIGKRERGICRLPDSLTPENLHEIQLLLLIARTDVTVLGASRTAWLLCWTLFRISN